MRVFLLSMSCIQCCIASPIHWSSPQVLFSSPTNDAFAPSVAINPQANKAQGLWLTKGSLGNIYSASCERGVWSSASSLSAEDSTPIFLQLSSDDIGTCLAIWGIPDRLINLIKADTNSGSEWSIPQVIETVGLPANLPNLHNIAASTGAFVVTWRGLNQGLHAVTFRVGGVLTPYLLSQEGLSVTYSKISNNLAVIATELGIYATEYNALASTASPVSMPLFYLSTAPYLGLDYNETTSIAVFQNQQSKFLVSSVNTGGQWSYATISTLNLPLESVKVAISSVGNRAAAIWGYSSGLVQAAIFNGNRWGSLTTLSLNGTTPSIAFDPTQDNPIAVWADYSQGANQNVIMAAEFGPYSWSATQTLSAAGSNVTSPAIDINSLGTAVVMWSRQENSASKYIIESSIGTR